MFFGGERAARRAFLHGDMACSALRYVPFRIPKRVVSRDGAAFLPKHCDVEMFHVSISMFHEVLNSRKHETGGWSAGNGSCAWQPRLFRIVFSTFLFFMNVRILPNRSALSPPFPKEGQGWFVE